MPDPPSVPPVQGVPPIGGIGTIPPIHPIPGVGQINWVPLLDGQIAGGEKNASKLADFLFFLFHPERVATDGKKKPLDSRENDHVKLRAEWNHYRTLAEKRLNPSAVPAVFLPEQGSRDYEKFVSKQTTGEVTFMLNGRTRSVSGTVVDKADTFVSMRQTVESLVEGDFLYLTPWEFKPTLAPLNPYILDKAWAELLRDKAAQGVKIRIIISLHSPLLRGAFNSDLAGLEKFINQVLPTDRRDNFKFIASEHPATVKLNTFIRAGLKGFGVPVASSDDTVLVGDHHQKFMVVRKGKTKLGYCGGLDITGRRTPVTFNDPQGAWSINWVWHDIHTKLEGAIVQDLEREFVERWNREKRRAKTSVRPSDGWKATKLEGWADHEKLEVTSGETEKRASDRNIHKVQMHRTVSAGAGVELDQLTPQITRRDDIWQSYFTIIGRARRFLYLENQYFYEPKLANAIVRQMQANPELVVMVVVSTGTDDAPGPYFNHCLKVRYEFFTQLFHDQSLKNRIGVYTMFYPFGIVHSKLALADDEVLSIGSANANQRGFFLDSELNVMLEDAEAVRALRLDLWSHNLATPRSLVGTWRPSQFIAQWDGVALYNKTREKRPESMMGEGVIRFDPLKDDRKEKYPRSHLDIMDKIPMLPDILC